jgi:predicted nucleic acid-binding protein
MSAAEAFFDTSVLLYLFSADGMKADRTEELLATGGVISVQVLSEFTSVGRRKLAMSWDELREALEYDAAFEVAARYDLAWYDAMIVGAALLAECSVVYSEDMHHGLRIKRTLKVVNPFK